jgi:hypothetical protein
VGHGFDGAALALVEDRTDLMSAGIGAGHALKILHAVRGMKAGGDVWSGGASAGGDDADGAGVV